MPASYNAGPSQGLTAAQLGTLGYTSTVLSAYKNAYLGILLGNAALESAQGPNVIAMRVGRLPVVMPVGGGVASVGGVTSGTSSGFVVGDQIKLASQNNGQGAILEVTASAGAITGLTLLKPGTGYTTAPTAAGAQIATGSGTLGTASWTTTLQGMGYPIP